MKGAPMKGKTQPVRPILIQKPLKINGYDIDVMGIVSNIVYIRWFEDLRFEFLDRYWPFENMLKSNRSPVLSTTHVKYRYPLTIYDRLVSEKPLCMHSLAAILPFYNALRFASRTQKHAQVEERSHSKSRKCRKREKIS
jgi:hypothetical protein